MMSDPPKMRSVSYTMSEADLERLAQLVAWLHPDDPKAVSMTVRECIRRIYEIERARHEAHEQTEGETGK